MIFMPELLSPAGSLEKLQVAVSYGADAVYLAGQKFGLRSAADNFTLDEHAEGIQFARSRGRLVYLVLNSFLHDSDLDELPGFLRLLNQSPAMRPDAVIASDLGVISVVTRETDFPVHLSTQASCLNEKSGQLWKNMGVKRLIFGREVSIREAGKIKRATGLEVELFIHGAMCMAYSGNCTISNFTRGRDSNRGGCAQSCRFGYSVEYADGELLPKTFFMSSKDLMGLEQIPLFFEEQIDSVKVEGRMKSPLYAGMTSKVYREALDKYAQQGSFTPEQLRNWIAELSLISHRDYHSGSLEGNQEDNLAESVTENSVYNEDEYLHSDPLTYQYFGIIKKVVAEKYILVEARAGLQPGMQVDLMPFEGAAISFKLDQISSAVGAPLENYRHNRLIRLPYQNGIEPGQILRSLVQPGARSQ